MICLASILFKYILIFDQTIKFHYKNSASAVSTFWASGANYGRQNRQTKQTIEDYHLENM